MTISLPPPQGFLESIDYNCFDLWTSFRDFFHASENGYHEGAVDAVLRHIRAHASFYYLCLSTLRTASNVVVAFSKKAPTFFFVVQNTSFILKATVCGFVANAIASVQETIGIIRQSRLLSIFHKNSYQENSLILAADLQAILKRYTPAELQTRLSPWFIKDNQLETYERLKELVAGIQNNNTENINEGIKLVAQMRSLAIKKLTMHIIGLLAVTISIAGLIGSLTACPPAAVFALLVIGTVLLITRTVMLNAYVDNPEGRFSLLRCLPNCIANRFSPSLSLVV